MIFAKSFGNLRLLLGMSGKDRCWKFDIVVVGGVIVSFFNKYCSWTFDLGTAGHPRNHIGINFCQTYMNFMASMSSVMVKFKHNGYIFIMLKCWALILCNCQLMFSESVLEAKGLDTNDDEICFSIWLRLDYIVRIESLCSRSFETAISKIHAFLDNGEDETIGYVSKTKKLEIAAMNSLWRKNCEVLPSFNIRYNTVWKVDTVTERKEIGRDLGGHKTLLFQTGYFPDFWPFGYFTYLKEMLLLFPLDKVHVVQLQPKSLVNDAIIDFYIKYLKDKMHLKKQQEFHSFNSFLMADTRKISRGEIKMRKIESEDGGQAHFLTRMNGSLKKTIQVDVFYDSPVRVLIFSNIGWLFEFATYIQSLQDTMTVWRLKGVAVMRISRRKSNEDILSGDFKVLTSLGLKELKDQEHLLNENLISIKERKLFAEHELKFLRMQEQCALEENQTLHSQTNEEDGNNLEVTQA